MMHLPKLLVEALLWALKPSRPPDFKIGGVINPYMNRWWIIPRNRWFNVYLHQMLRDDDDVLHDHPWKSISIVLHAPELYERYMTFMGDDHVWIKDEGTRKIETGAIVFRSSTFAHQMIVRQPAWTLFITGRVVREWGFHCPQGWRNWKDYVNIRDNVSSAGRGCGEQ